MQTPEPVKEYYQQPEESNYRHILFMLLRKWYWFVLCGLIGLLIAYFSNQFKQSAYSASSSIVIPSQGSGVDLRGLFSGYSYQSYSDIYNQMEILRSYSLNRQTLENLQWRTTWYTKKQPAPKSISSIVRVSRQKISRYIKKVFVWKEIYPNNLFNVLESPGAKNLEGIPIYITPVSDEVYSIKVDAESSGGSKESISFEEQCAFGRPFTNEWLSFILEKKAGAVYDHNQTFYFVFNNLNQQTNSYRGRLNVALKDEYSDVIQLQITGTDAGRLVEYLNELLRTFMAEKLERATETQRRSIEFIDSQLMGISDSLSEAGAVYSQFRARHQIVSLSAKGEQVMQSLEQINADLARQKIQIQYLQNLQSYIEEATQLDKLFAPSVVGIEDLMLNNLVVKIIDLYGRRQQISLTARENNPSLVMLDKEIMQAINLLKENLRNIINNALFVTDGLEKQKRNISLQLNELPGTEQNLINIQRKYDITNEIYTFLLQKRAEIYITLASMVSDVQVIDQARMETIGVIGTSSSRKTLTGLLIGLAVPLVIILLVNYFDDTIKSRDDVERNTHLPIMGNVIHSEHESPVPVVKYPRSSLAESYRNIRTNLQYMLSGDSNKIIAIQSTSPEEGKSFTAVNLASILAMNNNKVLLLGCDLRKPKIQKVFENHNKHGLSTYLIGNNTFDEIVAETGIENLWMAPSGPIPPNPAELLGKPELKKFLDRACERFDYIVMDNSPVSMVTDGLLTGKLADLNLFVLRADVSHKQMIKLINQLAEKNTLSHISLIINDIKANRLGYKYSYHSGYHYSHYYSRYGKGYYSDEEKLTLWQTVWKKAKKRSRSFKKLMNPAKW